MRKLCITVKSDRGTYLKICMDTAIRRIRSSRRFNATGDDAESVSEHGSLDSGRHIRLHDMYSDHASAGLCRQRDSDIFGFIGANVDIARDTLFASGGI